MLLICWFTVMPGFCGQRNNCFFFLSCYFNGKNELLFGGVSQVDQAGCDPMS